jgi:hypothetical protein
MSPWCLRPNRAYRYAHAGCPFLWATSPHRGRQPERCLHMRRPIVPPNAPWHKMGRSWLHVQGIGAASKWPSRRSSSRVVRAATRRQWSRVRPPLRATSFTATLCARMRTKLASLATRTTTNSQFSSSTSSRCALDRGVPSAKRLFAALCLMLDSAAVCMIFRCRRSGSGSSSTLLGSGERLCTVCTRQHGIIPIARGGCRSFATVAA